MRSEIAIEFDQDSGEPPRKRAGEEKCAEGRRRKVEIHLRPNEEIPGHAPADEARQYRGTAAEKESRQPYGRKEADIGIPPRQHVMGKQPESQRDYT